MNWKTLPYCLPMLIGVLLVCGSASAVFTISIDEGVNRGIPIAIVPFGGDAGGDLPNSIDSVISDDLSRTGLFDSIPADQHLGSPTSREEVNFSDWQLISADYVLIGRVEAAPERADSYRVVSRLFDSFEQKQVFGIQFIVDEQNVRQTAHRIANKVFESLIEKPSSFTSKILYTVAMQGDDGVTLEHALYMADYDGFNAQLLYSGPHPILSPSWSPDYTQIAYSELKGTGAQIIVHTVATGEKVTLATPAGYNSAADWSPDGRHIAFSNSVNGNYDIYIYALDTGRITQVTDHRLIDTEPAWSPDGQHLVFTSNRGGEPQIYRVPARQNATAQPLLISGRANTGARYSPTDDELIIITDQGVGSQVGIYDFSTRSVRVVSSTNLDDSAKYSPHGDMLIHVVEGSERYIKIMSPDGRVQSRIPVDRGRVKQVDWGSI